MSTPTDLPRPGTPPAPERLGPAFGRLVEVIAKLRSPEGCPWDRVQTLASIKPHTLEETYELLEAIDLNDNAAIAEELGDVLLQVVLDSQIAADEARFDLVDVIEGLTHKMVERHPHVFGDVSAHTPEDVLRNWERIKAQTKSRASVLDGVPVDLPALAKAARISSKAARAGYDWPDRRMLFDKLQEEVAELIEELAPQGEFEIIPAGVNSAPVPDQEVTDPARREHIEEELGDILFVVANIARRWHINPEEALRRSNNKFSRRFRAIEDGLRQRGKTFAESTLIEMEELYQQEKRREASTKQRS